MGAVSGRRLHHAGLTRLAPVERAWSGVARHPRIYIASIALIATAAALVAAVRPFLGSESLFVLLVAVLAATAYGGTRGGVAAALLSIAAADFAAFSPVFSFRLEHPSDVARLIAFAVFSPLVAVVYGESRAGARRIRRLNGELASANERLSLRERRQDAIAEIGRMAILAQDLDAFLEVAVAIIARVLDVEFVSALEIVPVSDRLLVRAGAGWHDGVVGSAPVSALPASLAGYTLAIDEPVVMPDLETETRFHDMPLLRAHNVRSAMTAVIRDRGARLGVLGAYSTRLREFSGDEVLFLRSVANLIGLATQERRSRDALRLSEAMYRSLGESTPASVIIVRLPATVEFCNQYFLEYAGVTMDEVRSGTLDYLVPPEDAARDRARFEEVLKTGETFDTEFRIRRHDGQFRWHFARVAPVEEGLQVAARWVIVCIDIDDRRRAQEELRASEGQLSAVVDAAADGIIIIGEDRTVRSFNPAAERMFGYAAEEVIGRDVSQLMPSPMREEHDGYVRRYIETGERRIIGIGREVEARRKDGSTFPIHLSISEVKVPEGRIFAGILHDLTQRKRAEERQRMLADATLAFNASLDVRETLLRIPAIVVPTLADCCIVFGFDPAGEPKPLGIACDNPERERKAWAAVTQYPPDLNRPFGLGRALTTGESDLYTEFERHWEQVSTHPGQLGFFQDLAPRSYAVVSLTTRRGIAGALTFVSYDAHRRFDATDLAYFEELARRASAAIENARLYADSQRTSEELRRASAAKDEFLGLVSHELRTPITTIYGNARLLRSRAALVPAEDREVALADVEHEAERLQRIIENLLVLARLEAAEQVDMEPIDVGKTVRRIAAEFGRRHPGIEINLALDERARAVVTQPTYFELILHNFLSNAAKYGAPGGLIDVVATPVDDEVEFRVLDRGAGVRPDEIEQLFSAFYRAKETRTLVGGMGIGLAVCKRLLDAQGARVWARPRPGGGAEFGFALSTKLAREVEDKVADAAGVRE